MEALYAQQSELAENIRKILVNFKKDSSERKTIEYGKRRIDALEAYWREYEQNHEKLLPLESRGHKYFAESEFERTNKSYLAAKTTIDRYYLDLEQQLGAYEPGESQSDAGLSSGRQQQPQTPAPAPPTPRIQRDEEIGSKLNLMLRRQLINFKAFMKTVESIDVESYQEKWEYEDALRALQTRWTVADNCHWEIMLELGEDEAYEYNYNKHERTYNGLRKALSSRMWSTSYRDKTTPQMDIPVFSGNFQQWLSFKDLFDEAIHKNPSLSNAQKMQFLKSKITGEAERLIQHLPISTDNYATCWEILNHRFNNKRHIFTSYIGNFYNLDNIQQQSFAAIKRLHDVTLESLHAIKNLGIDTKSWDPLLVYILSQKLDNDSYSEYIESLKNSRELPVLQDFMDFLEKKFNTLETSSQRLQDRTPKISSQQQQTSNFQNISDGKRYKAHEIAKSMQVSASAIKCPQCESGHRLINCKQFLESANEQKINLLNKLNFCTNCIYDHDGAKCYSAKRCHKCNENHHTILHDYFANLSQSAYYVEQSEQQEQHSNSNVYTSQRDELCEILLATALVKVTAADNSQHVMRALIDQGSQVSVISERAAQQLGLKRERSKGVIFGVGERENNCKGQLKITCQSTYTDFKFTADALIMSNLIKNLPNKTFAKPTWQHIAHISLADPDFNIGRPVDLLLGAEVYSSIILEGLIRGEAQSEPLAQHTQLGWLLCGSVKTSFQCNVILSSTEETYQHCSMEDTNERNEMSADNQRATTTSLNSGRFEGSSPVKPEVKENLVSSNVELSIAQVINLEHNRLVKQKYLVKKYKQFLSDYQQPNQMKLATSSSSEQRAELAYLSPQPFPGHNLSGLKYKDPNLQQDLPQQKGDVIKRYRFCDASTKVTVSWIQGSTERWKPLVANRVRKIDITMPPECWQNVNSKENPVDVESRGLTSSQLTKRRLWWQGPTFLMLTNFMPKQQLMKFNSNEEVREHVNVASNISDNSSISIEDLRNCHSSFTKVARIVAWIRRVLTFIVGKQRRPEYLTLHELRSANIITVKHLQHNEHNNDVEYLHSSKDKSLDRITHSNPYLLAKAQKKAAKAKEEIIRQNKAHLAKSSKQIDRNNQLPKFINFALAWIFYISIIWSSVSAIITQVSSDQSLYYDPVGKIKLTRDQRQIVSYYDSLQLYHLIPVPLQISSDMISINLVTDYIATNLMRDSYLPVTIVDLQGCEYQDEAYICQLQAPIQHLGPEEKFCQTEKMDTCKIKRESCKNKWAQLHDPSFYLYFACDTYSLTIICDRETQVRQVSKAGLIHLTKQCTAKGRDITLYSHQQQSTLNLKSDLVLTNIAPIQHHTFNFTLPSEPSQDHHLNTSLQQLGEQISAMKEAAQQEVTLTTHDIHQYAISYSVLAAGVAALLAFLWRRSRRAVSASSARAVEPAPERDPAPAPPPPPAPLLPREVSSRRASVSARGQPVPELGHGASGTVRWSSLRDIDTITLPISEQQSSRQSVFTLE